MDSHQHRWVVIIAVFLLASIYFFVFSESGLLERINLEKGNKSLITEIEELKSENSRLQRHLDSYRKGLYPGDDIIGSGYIKPGEKVIYLRGLKERDPGERDIESAPGFPFALPYLRMAWLAVSAIVVMLLVLYARKAGGEDKP